MVKLIGKMSTSDQYYLGAILYGLYGYHIQLIYDFQFKTIVYQTSLFHGT